MTYVDIVEVSACFSSLMVVDETLTLYHSFSVTSINQMSRFLDSSSREPRVHTFFTIEQSKYDVGGRIEGASFQMMKIVVSFESKTLR